MTITGRYHFILSAAQWIFGSFVAIEFGCVSIGIVQLGIIKVTILMVEQNAIKALDMSERVYVLTQGQFASRGKVNTVFTDSIINHSYLNGRAA